MSLSPSQPSPAPPLSRATLVLGLYAAMALTGLLVSSGRGNANVFVLGDRPGWLLGGGPALGLAIGLAVVGATRLATRYLAWARALHASFRDLLGSLGHREILIIALASSIGEEMLFRGALLPWLGLWWQGVVFALLHIGPGRRFVPWTVSAFGLGVGFGALAEWTGTLGGPIVAHFVINYLNLRYIVATPPSALRRARPAAAAAAD